MTTTNHGRQSKRDLAIIVAGIIIATVLTVVATWVLIGIISRSDPRDPMTKAGGLGPTQDIRKNK
jgi:hypothetical protein